MSGIEILGIAAGVLQIADAGARLSTKLFVMTRKVKNADKAIADISLDIAATGAALRDLGEALDQDKYAKLGSQRSFEATHQIVTDCWKVFSDINDTLGDDVIVKEGNGDSSQIMMARFSKSSFTFRQKLKFPFIEPQIVSLKAKLESLKSSLVLMLQVLMLAEQVRNRPQVEIADDQKSLIETLVNERNESEKWFKTTVLAVDHLPQTEAVTQRNDDDQSKVAGIVNKDMPRALQPADQSTNHATTAFLAGSDVQSPDSSVIAAAKSTILSQGPKFANNVHGSVRNPARTSGGPDVEQRQEFPHRPAILRIRRTEIQHHSQLVQRLLEEVASPRYKVDHGIRYRLHDGLLELHWNEWYSYAHAFGNETFVEMFERNDHQELAKFWLDKEHGHHKMRQPSPSHHGPPRAVESEIETKMIRERKLLQAAKDMRARTQNKAVITNLEKRIIDSEKNVAYLETRLHEALSRSYQSATPSDGDYVVDSTKQLPPSRGISRAQPSHGYAAPPRSSPAVAEPPPKNSDLVPKMIEGYDKFGYEKPAEHASNELVGNSLTVPERTDKHEVTETGSNSAVYDALQAYTVLTKEELQKAA